jgi:hypothetical protein
MSKENPILGYFKKLNLDSLTKKSYGIFVQLPGYGLEDSLLFPRQKYGDNRY